MSVCLGSLEQLLRDVGNQTGISVAYFVSIPDVHQQLIERLARSMTQLSYASLLLPFLGLRTAAIPPARRPIESQSQKQSLMGTLRVEFAEKWGAWRGGDVLCASLQTQNNGLQGSALSTYRVRLSTFCLKSPSQP